jgi:hypothetical protein
VKIKELFQSLFDNPANCIAILLLFGFIGIFSIPAEIKKLKEYSKENCERDLDELLNHTCDANETAKFEKDWKYSKSYYQGQLFRSIFISCTGIAALFYLLFKILTKGKL